MTDEVQDTPESFEPVLHPFAAFSAMAGDSRPSVTHCRQAARPCRSAFVIPALRPYVYPLPRAIIPTPNEHVIHRSQTGRSQGQLRQQHSKPILDEISLRLEDWSIELLPKSPVGQAVGYARGQWKALNRYSEQKTALAAGTSLWYNRSGIRPPQKWSRENPTL